MDIAFDTIFDPRHGDGVPVAPQILRVTAPNQSPFTFTGTNSYLLGGASLVVVDPGPDDDRHLAALLQAIAGRPVEAILLTHTHRDHTALVPRLQQAVGAPVLAEGRHRVSRPLHEGEVNLMDAAGDMALVPDRIIAHGEILTLAGLAIEAVATPGHTANHMAFSIGDTLLSGDHVMAWSTTIVAPPDGAMADYMDSLEVLIGREEALYLPGHGGPVLKPQAFLRGLRSHRKMRETAILERLKAGDRSIPDIVAAIYRQTDPRLHGAAGLSVLAHLEDLVAKGRVVTDGPALPGGRFEPA
ncbi:MBL fold metallo-hydrolase [Aureimonas sp. SA4125]|uniref:MBL fold metallo-hydrolase n=1 Tax=Aureimonas sp. SA4125 TaxID=2826993 RepID=UPI001CC766D9|nr:MBL fold metallo-hydrolase [Aureimonas sp. SA4125]BDA83122.1 MBL fold metallo-hydrolase [Aureimonas sp. SA4125]